MSQRAQLVALGGAAVQHRRPTPHRRTKLGALIVNLYRQLPRRRQHDHRRRHRPRSPPSIHQLHLRRLLRPARGDAAQRRQQKPTRLPRPSLRDRHHILPLQQYRPRLGLNRRRIRVPLRLERVSQRFRKRRRLLKRRVRFQILRLRARVRDRDGVFLSKIFHARRSFHRRRRRAHVLVASRVRAVVVPAAAATLLGAFRLLLGAFRLFFPRARVHARVIAFSFVSPIRRRRSHGVHALARASTRRANHPIGSNRSLYYVHRIHTFSPYKDQNRSYDTPPLRTHT